MWQSASRTGQGTTPTKRRHCTNQRRSMSCAPSWPALRKSGRSALATASTTSPAEETAREVADTLARKHWENSQAGLGGYRFLTTGDPRVFRELGERFLQLPLEDVRQVAVAELERAAA